MAFFDLEPVIIQRLSDTLGDAVQAVLVTAELADVLEEQQIAPAVHLIYSHYSIVSQNRATIDLLQQWIAVAVARNVRDIRAGSEARAEVAPVVDGVFTAFLGWPSPVGNGRPCELAAPPAKARIENGFIYVPTQWAFPITIKRP